MEPKGTGLCSKSKLKLSTRSCIPFSLKWSGSLSLWKYQYSKYQQRRIWICIFFSYNSNGEKLRKLKIWDASSLYNRQTCRFYGFLFFIWKNLHQKETGTRGTMDISPFNLSMYDSTVIVWGVSGAVFN